MSSNTKILLAILAAILLLTCCCGCLAVAGVFGLFVNVADNGSYEFEYNDDFFDNDYRFAPQPDRPSAGAPGGFCLAGISG